MVNEYPFENMPLPAHETDYLSIYVLESYSLLLVVWKRQISFEERKTGFGVALELTRKFSLKRWLIDDLQLYHFTPEEKEWILNDFQNLANQTTIHKLGVVTSDFYPGLIANKEFTEKGKERYKATGVIQHEVFTDHLSALDWLLLEE